MLPLTRRTAAFRTRKRLRRGRGLIIPAFGPLTVHARTRAADTGNRFRLREDACYLFPEPARTIPYFRQSPPSSFPHTSCIRGKGYGGHTRRQGYSGPFSGHLLFPRSGRHERQFRYGISPYMLDNGGFLHSRRADEIAGPPNRRLPNPERRCGNRPTVIGVLSLPPSSAPRRPWVES